MILRVTIPRQNEEVIREEALVRRFSDPELSDETYQRALQIYRQEYSQKI